MQYKNRFCVFVFSAAILLIIIQGCTAGSIDIQITNLAGTPVTHLGSYVWNQQLIGKVFVSFTEAIPENSLLRSYIDGSSVISSVDLTDRLPESYEYKTQGFDYGIKARINRSWIGYTDQQFDYYLKVTGTCGDQQCVDEGTCNCLFEIGCEAPSSPPYKCEWSVEFAQGFTGIVDGSSLKEIYDGLDSVTLPTRNNDEDTVWYVMCSDYQYRESCDYAIGNSHVQLTMRAECNDPLMGGLWVERQIFPSGWDPCTHDIYTDCNPGDRYKYPVNFPGDTPERGLEDQSLTWGYRKYGGPSTPQGGGIYKKGEYQDYGTDVLWDGDWAVVGNYDKTYRMGIVVILVGGYDSQAQYIINYLPANGPKLCAYTEVSEPVFEIDYHSVTENGECSYGNPYTETYTEAELAALFNDIPNCTGVYECEILDYTVVDNDPGDSVTITPTGSSTPPITVTGSTDSKELDYEYNIYPSISLDEFSNLNAPSGKGEHTLTFRIEHGPDVLATQSIVFTTCSDEDVDGYCSTEEGGQDCDDSNKYINPEGVEICDYLDNNCNGEIDEGYNASRPGSLMPCGIGICSGFIVCAQDGLNVTCNNTVEPGDMNEICNDTYDNDCDGEIDEDGYWLSDVWQNCTPICIFGESSSCGTNLGICSLGYQLCSVNNEWGPCIGGVSPCEGKWDNLNYDCEDVCNKLDDDCDGIVDNFRDGESAEETKCWCYGGQSSRQETVDPCNDIDDDCDGEIDEGLVCCTAGETRQCGSSVGECTFGTQTCTAQGTWQGALCIGGIEPATEVCYDGKDNDCDGETDEFCEPSITCFNGLQDLNEEGVDCGGPCDKNCENPGSWLIAAIVIIAIIVGFAFFQLRK